MVVRPAATAVAERRPLVARRRIQTPVTRNLHKLATSFVARTINDVRPQAPMFGHAKGSHIDVSVY